MQNLSEFLKYGNRANHVSTSNTSPKTRTNAQKNSSFVLDF